MGQNLTIAMGEILYQLSFPLDIIVLVEMSIQGQTLYNVNLVIFVLGVLRCSAPLVLMVALMVLARSNALVYAMV